MKPPAICASKPKIQSTIRIPIIVQSINFPLSNTQVKLMKNNFFIPFNY